MIPLRLQGKPTLTQKEMLRLDVSEFRKNQFGEQEKYILELDLSEQFKKMSEYLDKRYGKKKK